MHEKNSNSKWTRLSKPSMYLHSNSFQLLPHLETPQYFIHPNTLRQSPINALHWSRDCRAEGSEMSSWNTTWMNIKSLRTLEQFGKEDWENHISAYMPDHVSEPSSVNVTGWGQGLPQNQGEKRQPEYVGSKQIMFGQVPGRKGWWDEWKLPSSTRLRSFRYKWCSKMPWGKSEGEMTVLQEERSKDRLP